MLQRHYSEEKTGFAVANLFFFASFQKNLQWPVCNTGLILALTDTFSKDVGHFSASSHRLEKSCSLPALVKFAFAVCQERHNVAWKYNAINLVIRPFLNLRLMVSHISYVVVPLVRLVLVETHSM